MKTLYIECKMGAAGDMLQGALYELLDSDQQEFFLQKMNALFPDAVSVHPLAGAQCGISGTKMQVLAAGHEEHAGEDGHIHMHEAQDCEHAHEHMHGPDHEHALDHEHEADHEHEVDQAQGHVHEHMNEPDHAHTHEHEHMHAPDHTHIHEHEHMHAHSHSHPHVHYSYPDICSRIHSLPLPADILSDAEAVYRSIGDAEAKAHNSTLEQIHFHEVGSLDAIADVVGVCLLISLLKPEQILVSPIHVGNGTVHCAHGILPVPAPATAEILKGVPYYTGEIMSELCTPTGAALLKHFANRFCTMPIMTIQRTGNGLGTKVFPVANMVRVFLGDTIESREETTTDRILEISCNLDDMTGEELGYAMDALLNAGALDVFYQPIYMKKNRPGVILTCFCPPQDKEKFALLMLRLTSTRGVRFQEYSRMKLESHFEEISTPWGPVHKKISAGYGIAKEKYEYDDLRRIAAAEEISFAAVRRQLEEH